MPPLNKYIPGFLGGIWFGVFLGGFGLVHFSGNLVWRISREIWFGAFLGEFGLAHFFGGFGAFPVVFGLVYFLLLDNLRCIV